MVDFLTVYSEAGMIGVVGAMFIFLVFTMSKRASQQADALEDLKVENEEQSVRIANIDEIRDRRHEDLVKEVNDMSDVLMEVKGNVSRINGRH